MPADLDQFGRKNSDGAFIRRKGLIQLSHMAANGGSLIHQIDLKPRIGKIERGLNATDPSADYHHVAEILRGQGFK